MTTLDYRISDLAPHHSVTSEPIRGGYRLRAATRHAIFGVATRVVIALTIFGLVAAGGMVWTLSDATFASYEPSIVKALLSASIYIVAVAVFVSSGISKMPDHVNVDLKNRVLLLGKSRKRAKCRRIRFEEIVRLDLQEGTRMADLQAIFSRLDYGRITAVLAGGKTVDLVGGDVAELDRLLSDLRADTGVA